MPVLRLILPELISKDLSNRPIYAVLNTHNLDIILQLKYMPIVMNPIMCGPMNPDIFESDEMANSCPVS